MSCWISYILFFPNICLDALYAYWGCRAIYLIIICCCYVNLYTFIQDFYLVDVLKSLIPNQQVSLNLTC